MSSGNLLLQQVREFRLYEKELPCLTKILHCVQDDIFMFHCVQDDISFTAFYISNKPEEYIKLSSVSSGVNKWV